MLNHPLATRLRQLKLSGMLLSLENRAAQAAEGGLSPSEFLALLLDDELERRNQAKFGRALKESGIEASKTLAQFDFAAAPQLNRTLILELANAGFVGRAENLLLCGPTGTGKSHISHALAFEALKRGHRWAISCRISGCRRRTRRSGSAPHRVNLGNVIRPCCSHR